VQMQSVFEDSKTFPDCIPKANPELIVAKYQSQRIMKTLISSSLF
jgi:hypothetical protein